MPKLCWSETYLSGVSWSGIWCFTDTYQYVINYGSVNMYLIYILITLVFIDSLVCEALTLPLYSSAPLMGATSADCNKLTSNSNALIKICVGLAAGNEHI